MTKQFNCDDCNMFLTKETKNTVTIRNVFNKPVKMHYCAGCAHQRWPFLVSMISWTKPERRT